MFTPEIQSNPWQHVIDTYGKDLFQMTLTTIQIKSVVSEMHKRMSRNDEFMGMLQVMVNGINYMSEELKNLHEFDPVQIANCHKEVVKVMGTLLLTPEPKRIILS